MLTAERLSDLARVSFEAAMDENYPVEIRRYYAALALWADKKATTLAKKGS
jgi:hypothetical protein